MERLRVEIMEKLDPYYRKYVDIRKYYFQIYLDLPTPAMVLDMILNNIWDKVIFPLIKIILILNILSCIAGISGYVIRNWLLPSAVVNEIIYFDFHAQPQPIASYNLLNIEKQWEYIDRKHVEDMTVNRGGHKKRIQYLTPGLSYHFDLELIVPLSKRNVDLNKFMLHMLIYDASGDAIAKSARPVVIYTQSDICRLFTSLWTYPLRMLGILPMSEGTYMYIPFVSDYKEPYLSNYPSTEVIDISISTHDADIDAAYLTIMPAMGSIMTFVYYHPFASWCILSLIILWCELSCLALYIGYAKVTALESHGNIGIVSGSGSGGDIWGDVRLVDAPTEHSNHTGVGHTNEADSGLTTDTTNSNVDNANTLSRTDSELNALNASVALSEANAIYGNNTRNTPHTLHVASSSGAVIHEDTSRNCDSNGIASTTIATISPPQVDSSMTNRRDADALVEASEDDTTDTNESSKTFREEVIDELDMTDISMIFALAQCSETIEEDSPPAHNTVSQSDSSDSSSDDGCDLGIRRRYLQRTSE